MVLNYIPFVIWSVQRGRHLGGVAVMLIIFHILLALVLLSWGHTSCTDPGTPPEQWQRQQAALAASGQVDLRVCRRSGLYKPPRSHYCSVTQRLTLNMDHFCPWVANTVGFYNRKFFLLFLLYTCTLICFTLIALVPQLPGLWTWALEASERGEWLPGILNVVVLVAMGVVDVLLLVLLVPFLFVHLRMVARNQTTIDGDRFPKYDVGTRRNFEQVFGARSIAWFVPLYMWGPNGDGIRWPCRPPEQDESADVSRASPTASPRQHAQRELPSQQPAEA